MAAIGQPSQPTRPRISAATSSGARKIDVRPRRSESSTTCRRDSRPRPARSTDRRAQPATNTPATRDPPAREKDRRHEASGPHSARRSTSRFPPTRTAQAPAPHREWRPCSDCGHQLVQIRGPAARWRGQVSGGRLRAAVADQSEPDRSEAGCRPSPLASLTSPSNVSPDVVGELSAQTGTSGRHGDETGCHEMGAGPQ